MITKWQITNSKGGDEGGEETCEGSGLTRAIEELAGGLDLVAALRRQEPFMRSILEKREDYRRRLGATRGTVALDEYRDFMALQRLSPGPAAPSPLVDLLWHTHMQHPQRYAADCVRLAGRFIDHDDDPDTMSES